eukprot:SAG22_NODE_266_length_13340_cov_257.988445_5_plen_64_part_00
MSALTLIDLSRAGKRTLQNAIENNVAGRTKPPMPDWDDLGAAELELNNEPMLEGWLSLGFSTY